MLEDCGGSECFHEEEIVDELNTTDSDVGLATMLQRLEDMLELTQYFDVTLVGGGKQNMWKTSSLMLAAVSPYLHQLLVDASQHAEQDFAVILPDFSDVELEDFMSAMYSGCVTENIWGVLNILQCPFNYSSQSTEVFQNRYREGPQYLEQSVEESSEFTQFDIEDLSKDEKKAVSITKKTLKRSRKSDSSKVLKMKNQTAIQEYECKLCNLRYEKLASLEAHMKGHNSEGKLGCQECSAMFLTLRGLKEHTKLHESGEVKCYLCDEIFQSSWNLKNHMQIHRRPKTMTKEEEKNDVCHICAKKFGGRRALQSHIKSIHRDDLLSCDQCNKQFNSEVYLRNHLLLHKDPEIQCPYCVRLFHTKNYLKAHILRLHTPWNELPYCCTQCEKGFMDKSVWMGHLSMHAGTTPFKCRYCPREYQNQSNKLVHEKKKHPDLYTKVSKTLGSTRIKDRMNGTVATDELDVRPVRISSASVETAVDTG